MAGGHSAVVSNNDAETTQPIAAGCVGLPWTRTPL